MVSSQRLIWICNESTHAFTDPPLKEKTETGGLEDVINKLLQINHKFISFADLTVMTILYIPSLPVLIGVSDGIHAVIGNYPNVTDSDCGMSRESRLLNDKCFTYHKTSGLSRIANGRDTKAGETSYAVLIEIEVRSTSNNCNASKYTCPFTINILIGVIDWTAPNLHYYGAARVYPHPDYKFNLNSIKPDIGLIRVNTSIPFTDRLAITNVCLPARGLVNTGSEYALITGWGHTGKLPVSMIRQMGWVRIVVTDPNRYPTNDTRFIFGHITPLTSGTAACEVSTCYVT
ncbi:unnamed protein product [Medioppia subpectinata]|uniref:Uncharacterized protein n=1 Tax=Medioppia subpectinata TaxID=1979941 RepID=A0A7R9PW25_9ACAR|nr:unnamed protein product [Medioppia subpectinata]CAG2102877.1 unnamed protein product [Medioppia subpectinata]